MVLYNKVPYVLAQCFVQNENIIVQSRTQQIVFSVVNAGMGLTMERIMSLNFELLLLDPIRISKRDSLDA